MIKSFKYYINGFIILILQASHCSDILSQDYLKTDSIVKLYPKTFSNPKELSELIHRDFNLTEEKARAIYAWIGYNIRYDVDIYFYKKKKYNYKTNEEKIKIEKKYQQKLANQAIKKGKAICYGYSSLFKILCDLCDIKSKIIVGGTKTNERQIGNKPLLNAHSWNAVKVNETWQLIDVTWGAGTVNEEKRFVPNYTDIYFFTPPDLFFLNHFPKDTTWLLVSRTKEDFVNLPLYYDNYLKTNVNIISPTEGIIKIRNNDTINIEVANISKYSDISYSFSNDQHSVSIEPILKENDLSVLQIINKLTKNSFLTIYLDYKPVVSYKILLN